MLTSTANPKIKHLIQLKSKARLRRQENVFVVEGIRMFRELPVKAVKELYVTESFLTRNHVKEHLEKMTCGYEVVSEEVFAKISDTVTPQGVLAVVSCFDYSMKELLKKDKPFLMMVEDIQDPGNLGTIFRTAEAAGVDGIIMTRDTVDVYNPKVVRSTMGSIFRVPFICVDSMPAMMQILKTKSIPVYAAALQESYPYTEIDYSGSCAILVGNEGNGLKEETIACADKVVRIPMEGKVESLNASISAAILLFEAARQRR